MNAVRMFWKNYQTLGSTASLCLCVSDTHPLLWNRLASHMLIHISSFISHNQQRFKASCLGVSVGGVSSDLDVSFSFFLFSMRSSEDPWSTFAPVTGVQTCAGIFLSHQGVIRVITPWFGPNFMLQTWGAEFKRCGYEPLKHLVALWDSFALVKVTISYLLLLHIHPSYLKCFKISSRTHLCSFFLCFFGCSFLFKCSACVLATFTEAQMCIFKALTSLLNTPTWLLLQLGSSNTIKQRQRWSFNWGKTMLCYVSRMPGEQSVFESATSQRVATGIFSNRRDNNRNWTHNFNMPTVLFVFSQQPVICWIWLGLGGVALSA